MTWGQFKKYLDEVGVKDDDILLRIDTGNYPTTLRVGRIVREYRTGADEIFVENGVCCHFEK